MYGVLKEEPKKKAKGKAQRNKSVEDNDDSVVIVPEGITDSKDDAFVLIPVSYSNCVL